MKELSIEEKAKAYDYAINKAKDICDTSVRNTLKELFPELKESEDERIRKMLIEWVTEFKKLNPTNANHNAECSEAIAWLEKQGSQNLANSTKTCKEEQKQNNKVEPKFKIGDWIIYCDYEPEQIIGIRTNVYEMSNGDIRPFYMIDNNHNAKLWTIQDAKDGDVLCCESGWTCIFKALNNHTNTFSSYCFMDSDKWFCNTGSSCHTLDKTFITAYNGEINPATKEQRDQLEKAIADAGYEWDAEKKELKNIKNG